MFLAALSKVAGTIDLLVEVNVDDHGRIDYLTYTIRGVATELTYSYDGENLVAVPPVAEVAQATNADYQAWAKQTAGS